MKINRRLQMQDIAQLAGVSTATVSRALNNSPLVKEETKLKIRTIAHDFNYQMDYRAQQLRRGHRKTIAIAIPYHEHAKQPISDPFIIKLLGYLSDILTEQGYDVLLMRITSDPRHDFTLAYASGRVSGFIMMGQWGLHETLNHLASKQIPLVVWGAPLSDQYYSSIGSDNLEGGRMATLHLLEQGYRKLVFLGDISQPEVYFRHAGYVAALKTYGLLPNPDWVIPVSFEAHSARQTLSDFLKKGFVFDALFATSDLIAMTAMGLLYESGYHIPNPIGLVGYDNIDAAAHCHPPLTTIEQPLQEAASQLVHALNQQIDHGVTSSKMLTTQLIVRGSSILNS